MERRKKNPEKYQKGKFYSVVGKGCKLFWNAIVKLPSISSRNVGGIFAEISFLRSSTRWYMTLKDFIVIPFSCNVSTILSETFILKQ